MKNKFFLLFFIFVDIQTKILEENESSGHDFSDSGSEYSPSDSEVSVKSTQSESVEEDMSSTDSEDNISENTKSIKYKLEEVPDKILNQTKRTKRNYTIKTDDYFSNHASKKIVTSNHTLDKLETPRLPQDQLHKLLSKLELNNEHSIGLKKIQDSCRSYFKKWLYLMQENFSILLYGLGSKKRFLDSFHKECLSFMPVIVINGFFPAITIKEILDSIIVNLLELKENFANVHEACELIEKEFSFIPNTHLYLIVHNIDMLTSGNSQNVFARLASVQNIHLICSIDHINAPLGK